MKKLRKMMGDLYQPEIQSLMRLIETQSKSTLANWILEYTEENYLPLCAAAGDKRAQNAIAAAREWLDGKIKLPEAKRHILACHEAAREAEGDPLRQAALRAVGQAASVIHVATHALGIAFYGGAVAAYSKAGLAASREECDKIAAQEFKKIFESLKNVAIENEPNPVKVNWNC